jgi:hypothetical protein
MGDWLMDRFRPSPPSPSRYRWIDGSGSIEINLSIDRSPPPTPCTHPRHHTPSHPTHPIHTQVDPATVYFSHSKIRTTFSGCGRKVEATLQEIVDGRLTPSELPFITISRDPATGHLFSINNRRLWVLKRCREQGLLGPSGVVRMRLKREDGKNPARWLAEGRTFALEAKLCLK